MQSPSTPGRAFFLPCKPIFCKAVSQMGNGSKLIPLKNKMKFIKEVNEILPFDRELYIDYLLGETQSPVVWYGASFQISANSEAQTNVRKTEAYESLLNTAILKFDPKSIWIVNHDDKDLKWLPKKGDNLSSLRALFDQYGVRYEFSGALIFTQDELLAIFPELIAYPRVAAQVDGRLYKDLDITHNTLPLVIKISGHFNIDFLSTDLSFFKRACEGLVK